MQDVYFDKQDISLPLLHFFLFWLYIFLISRNSCKWTSQPGLVPAFSCSFLSAYIPYHFYTLQFEIWGLRRYTLYFLTCNGSVKSCHLETLQWVWKTGGGERSILISVSHQSHEHHLPSHASSSRQSLLPTAVIGSNVYVFSLTPKTCVIAPLPISEPYRWHSVSCDLNLDGRAPEPAPPEQDRLQKSL